VLLTAGAVMAAAAMYYLYQRQLGAISFFILSIVFFFLAFAQLKKRKRTGSRKADNESEKSREKDR
jgi:membrane protein implicated in regulation of membrane protease activity